MTKARFLIVPRVMDVDWAAAYLGFSRKTLERYMAAGKVKTARFESPDNPDRMLDKIVFDRLDLDKFVENYLR